MPLTDDAPSFAADLAAAIGPGRFVICDCDEFAARPCPRCDGSGWRWEEPESNGDPTMRLTQFSKPEVKVGCTITLAYGDVRVKSSRRVRTPFGVGWEYEVERVQEPERCPRDIES